MISTTKFAFFIIVFYLFSFNYMNSSSTLAEARQLYYKATKEEEAVEPAIEMFEKIKEQSNYTAVAKTYLGSLLMLKGKYAFWPQKKVQFVNEGLKVMDEGLAIDPDNLEGLFIYGSTCYYLPFFFSKADDAKAKLVKIVDLMSAGKVFSSNKLAKNAIDFILKNIELDSQRKEKAEKLFAELKKKND